MGLYITHAYVTSPSSEHVCMYSVTITAPASEFFYLLMSFLEKGIILEKVVVRVGKYRQVLMETLKRFQKVRK